MAPNLLLKAGFVRGDYDSIESVSKCRTDYILQNCYSHFIGKSNNFKPMSPVNSKEERVFMAFKSIIDEFSKSFTNPIKDMARQMEDYPMDFLPEVLQSVAAELFNEGINWSRIIAFIVFVGELGLLRVPHDESGVVINKLYESFCRHVKENLLSWIEEHGSWEGVEECFSIKNDFSPKIDTTTSSDLNTTESSDQGWYKNIATGALRVVGTFCQLATPRVNFYA